MWRAPFLPRLPCLSAEHSTKTLFLSVKRITGFSRREEHGKMETGEHMEQKAAD